MIGYLGLESGKGRRASTGDYSRTVQILPLPTCNKSDEEILDYKLTRAAARDFLKITTSFAGLIMIEPFGNPDLSLCYTLTRTHPSKKSVPLPVDIDQSVLLRSRDSESEIMEKHTLGEWTLYITAFDHKEPERTYYDTRLHSRQRSTSRHCLLNKIGIINYGNRTKTVRFFDTHSENGFYLSRFSITRSVRHAFTLETTKYEIDTTQQNLNYKLWKQNQDSSFFRRSTSKI